MSRCPGVSRQQGGALSSQLGSREVLVREPSGSSALSSTVQFGLQARRRQVGVANVASTQGG